MGKKAYALAGVDIDLGNRVKAGLPALLAATHRHGVMGKVGGFGGLFELDLKKYKNPVLVSSVDGVGTKLKIAFAMGRHDTIGQDLVNHCVNDIAVLGAEPLFFLDYIGTGKLDPKTFRQIISGFSKACVENNCALIGGETAQMPGFYQPGEYDLSGTIVGVVEKSLMLTGANIRKGDVIIGLASSGLHTNGYSLARKILFEEMGLKLGSKVAGLRTSLGEELLKVHVSYGPLVLELLKSFNSGSATKAGSARSRSSIKQEIHGIAHITGGGFVDNIPRVLPKNCDAQIEIGSWPLSPLFQLLKSGGTVPQDELYQVFNMGIGMVLIVAASAARAVMGAVDKCGIKCWEIGEITAGRGRTKI